MTDSPAVAALTIELDPADRPRNVILRRADGQSEYYPVTGYSGVALGRDVRHYDLGSRLVTGQAGTTPTEGTQATPMPLKTDRYTVHFTNPGRPALEITAGGYTRDDEALPGFIVFVDQDHVMVHAVKADEVFSIERQPLEDEAAPPVLTCIAVNRGILNRQPASVHVWSSDGTRRPYPVTSYEESPLSSDPVIMRLGTPLPPVATTGGPAATEARRQGLL